METTMEQIEKNLSNKKEKIEKTMGLDIAASIAVIIYAFTTSFTIIIGFLFAFYFAMVVRLILEYKKWNRANKIFEKVKAQVANRELTEREGVHILENTDV